MVEVEAEGEVRTYEAATSYDITADGTLVLYCEDKPFAAYNKNYWVSASMNPDEL